MQNQANKILQALEEHGELTLEEISKLIPKRHNDHKDFYVFASLISQGFIDDPFIPETNASSNEHNKEQLLARKYFAMSNAETKATYENYTWSFYGGTETLKGQKVALSGKGQLYLSNQRTQRFDRAFAIGAGILIGIMVALCSVLIERHLGA